MKNLKNNTAFENEMYDERRRFIEIQVAISKLNDKKQEKTS